MRFNELMTGARHFITRTAIEVDGMDENAYEERNASVERNMVGQQIDGLDVEVRGVDHLGDAEVEVLDAC